MSNPNIRNLPVPYFSQRENKHIWHEREPKTLGLDENKIPIPNPNVGNPKENGKTQDLADCSCNITCLAMLLHYSGISSETPDQIMKNIFEPAGKGVSETDAQKAVRETTYGPGKYAKIESIYFMKELVNAFYPNTTVFESNGKKDMAYIETQVANGYPVMISCGIARRYAQSYYEKYITQDKEIKIIKTNYQNLYNSKYDDDLKSAEENLKVSTDKKSLVSAGEVDEILDNEIAEAQIKLDEIKTRYESETQKHLNYYLDYYRYQGHYIVIRGFTEDSIIINDPWGSPINNMGEVNSDGNDSGMGFYNYSPFGDNIKISKSDFEKQYNEVKNLWATFVIHHHRWNFVFNNNTLPKGIVPSNEQFESCFDQETFDYGGFPMKRSNLWHNGIHLASDSKTLVYPIGPGQIIAARILNENPEKRDSDPAPLNGSRCFVLVKHQILLDQTTLTDFFSLYMHLSPIDNFENILEEYPTKTTGLTWLDSLLFRSNKIFRICWGRDAIIYRTSDNTPIGKLESSQVKAYEKVEEGKYYYVHEGEDCYSFQVEDGKYKILTYYNYDKNEDESIQQYKTKLETLSKGEITYFNDLPDPNIEVTGSTSIGSVGTYGGYDGAEKNQLHLEIFSNENLIGNYVDEEIHLIDYNSTSNIGLCNRREMIELFHNEDAYSNSFEKFVYLENDGIISKNEMTTFYKSNLSNNLRYYICQHISEWSDKIDWESEINTSVGMPKEGIWIPIKEYLGIDSIGSISDYIKYIYEPYKWLNDNTVKAMSPIKDDHLSKGCATFYHPIQFLKWLYKNDEDVIELLKSSR